MLSRALVDLVETLHKVGLCRILQMKRNVGKSKGLGVFDETGDKFKWSKIS